VKAVRAGGRDLPSPDIDVPEEGSPGKVEVAVAFDGATLTGAVQPPESAGRGHRVTSAKVALYPQDNQSPYLVRRDVTTDGAGNFTLEGIAPGAYTAFALPAETTLEWDDPDVRQRFSRYGRAVDLAVAPGSRSSW